MTTPGVNGWIVVVALASMTSLASPADDFTAVGLARTFSFDGADGYYDHWSGPLDCSINAIRGTVHFTRFGKPTTKWKPGITIIVYSGQGNAARYVRFGATARAYRAPFTMYLGAGLGDRNPPDEKLFAAAVGADETFPFFLSWTRSGTVSSLVQRETISVSLGGAADRIEINGSTGAGTVDFVLGHVPDTTDKECHPIA